MSLFNYSLIHSIIHSDYVPFTTIGIRDTQKNRTQGPPSQLEAGDRQLSKRSANKSSELSQTGTRFRAIPAR